MRSAGVSTERHAEPGVRALSVGAAMLCLSVLADSGVEHYRGLFRNRVMVVPLAVSAVGAVGNLLAATVHRGFGRIGQAALALTGASGLGFHAWNILKRPGGLSWRNLFYAAPAGAPAALVLAGVISALARSIDRGSGRAVRRTARFAGGVVSVGIAGTVAEAWLLHFRGAFHNRAMYLPVSIPPLAAASLAVDAIDGKPRPRTALLLGATALMGLGGVGFHAYGVSRNMGGWRNWRQNVLAGPPLPAPPSFTGLAIAGLGILAIMRHRRG
ncbi:MAG: hypothetical protein GC201_16975 [Alphaproteobacteria bacterium]|nr:hypothetical protein [Alphaproteobacteria bacterium]